MKKPALANFRIQSQGRISQLCLDRGLYYLQDVIAYLKSLPYIRTSDKRDLAMVLVEERGTCSAKHALLVQLAHENGEQELRLVLCTYNITSKVHPEMADVLQQHQLRSIPEARCFIKYRGGIYNLCDHHSPKRPDIISEIEIAPMQTVTFKKRYHMNYIENWLQIERLHKHWSYEQIWNIRETCIRTAEQKPNGNRQLLCCA